MKTKQTFLKGLYLVLFALPICTLAQKSISEWSYKTNGNITNAPTVSNNITYIGSYDHVFYAIDSIGQKLWSFETNYPVQSGSVKHDATVCFQSGNRLYGLSTSDGSLIWKHEPQEVIENEPVVMINDIDIKDATPILKDSVLYYGNEYGKFYGLDISTGTELFMFNTEKGYPITSTGIFSNDTVYFGDMEGYVYAVNTSTNEKLWEMRIFDGNKPYAESGPVIGNLVIDDDLLYFGLQHGVLSVVNRFTGEVAFAVGDNYGTWYSGTPLVNNGVMYVGTSDSKQLVALNSKTGEQLWAANIERGIYNQPQLYNNQLIVLGGYDTYEKLIDANGSGRLVILDLDGNIVNKMSLKGSAFGNTVIANKMLYFGTMDDHVYKLSLDKITDNAKPVIEFDNSDLDLSTITDDGNIRVELPLIYNSGTKNDVLKFEWNSNNLPEESVTITKSKALNAQDSAKLSCTIKGRLLENANYDLTFIIKSENNTELQIEKKISFSRSVVSIKNKPAKQGSIHSYPNPCSNTVNFVLPNEFVNGTLNIFNANGKLIQSDKIINTGSPVAITLNESNNKNLLYYYLYHESIGYYSGVLLQK